MVQIFVTILLLLLDGTKYNYNELLAKSIYFYEIQRSGLLPSKFKRVKWRGDSMLKDGCSVDVDLSRGWFDGKKVKHFLCL